MKVSIHEDGSIHVGGEKFSESELNNKIRKVSSWIFVISIISLLNTVFMTWRIDCNLLMGLAITQFIHGFGGACHQGDYLIIFLVIQVVIISSFVFLGYFTRKQVGWAYYCAFWLYLIDAIIPALIQCWPPLIGHLIALVFMWSGMKAFKVLKAINEYRANNISGPSLPPSL